ncbi:hypothetical protein INT45_010881 [Circinella minor]|uniref:Grh/CP2 DB domain-containing protein n=1 Tax=Circinella minor TaxID=1195481 RepID=A0A8H7VN04_9FUNG|nr:hypothetical protein INT45_010881 [Circinella minor]
MLSNHPHQSYQPQPPPPLPPLQQTLHPATSHDFPQPPLSSNPVFVDNNNNSISHHPHHHHHNHHQQQQQHYRREIPIIHPQHHSPVSLVHSSPGQQSVHSSPIMHSYPTATIEHQPPPHHYHHQQHHHHSYASPRSQTSTTITSVVPSPPTSCPSSAAIPNLRYEIILEAPTAAAQKVEEAPLTYLNKGQFYNINVKDTESIDVEITSTIKITFHDESHRKVASNYWKFWMSQQKHGQARAIDIDTGRCSGVHNVEANYFDSISFQWNGKAGASISIRFNCLSTDFSRIKGVKGIPLRLHMDNRLTNDSPPASESSFCRIKLFRDKGAERKNKDDARHIEKQLEKLRGKNGESHPLWLAFSQTQPYTVFCEMSSSSPVMQQQPSTPQDLAFARRLSDSSSSTSKPHRGGPIVSQQQQHHHHYLPPPLSNNTSFNNGTSAGMKRSYPSQPLMTPPAGADPNAAASMTVVGTSSMSPSGTTSNPYFMHHSGMPPPTMPIDYDPTYVPQRRRRIAKLGIFAKFSNAEDGLHRAIYLDELTVQDLKEKLTAKMDINPMHIAQVVRQVAKKENLVVRMDDSVVQDIPELQDMTIDTKQNDDGSLTLIVCY